MPVIEVVWRQVQKNQKFKVGAWEMGQLLNTRAPAGDLGSISSSLMAGPSSMALVQGDLTTSSGLHRKHALICTYTNTHKQTKIKSFFKERTKTIGSMLSLFVLFLRHRHTFWKWFFFNEMNSPRFIPHQEWNLSPFYCGLGRWKKKQRGGGPKADWSWRRLLSSVLY